ncbi:MAG TPA: site-2 protease family protein, partial [Anaerolineae bacterium]|nr:site-2 protease family protein [Anaerolineae bacterium]
MRTAVADVFDVYDVTVGEGKNRDVVRLRGRLVVDSMEAYRRVSARFRELGCTTWFRREGEDDVILAVPGPLPEAKTRVGLALLLFGLTVVSVMYAGLTWSASEELSSRFGVLAGWPFAISLLTILLAHELGHFIVARRLGVSVSLPYFIPFPVNFLGTLGAFINMKAPPTNKRDLLSIAVAGPLAGLVVAVPILILGLSLSSVQPLPPGGGYLMEGNSLLYLAIKFAVFGKILPSGGEDVFLHPVALAGWVGLLVTGLNLIPAGQLDGGHAVYALSGKRAQQVTWAMMIIFGPKGSGRRWWRELKPAPSWAWWFGFTTKRAIP